MAYSRYNWMIKDIRPLQQEIETAFNTMQPAIDKTASEMMTNNGEEATCRFLTEYCGGQAEQTTARWKKLGEYLLVKHLDGNLKKEKDGKFLENGYGQPAMPDFPGYSQEYYRSIAESTGDRLKVTF